MQELEQLPVRIEPMTVNDLGQVLEIERVAFPSPWSARAYEYELRYNGMAHYFVARLDVGEVSRRTQRGVRSWFRRFFRAQADDNNDLVVGYTGYWLMAGEAHISTIAVRPEYRGRAFGELLLTHALSDATRQGGHVATLEVRVSNTNAQRLYLKYGFEKVGMRKAYYSDNNEDAFIMTTPALNAASYQETLRRLRIAMLMRLQENLSRPMQPARANA